VSVVGDSEIEADETFTVVLSDATGAALGDSEGLGTILDDDADVAPAPEEGDAADDDGPEDDGAEVAGAEAERSALPRTGTTARTIAAAGLVLVLAGAAARAARRRLV
jgi:LPXTG-motif cell wall-anchored protein